MCTIYFYCNNIIRIIEINVYFRRYIGMVLAIAGILMAAGATICGLQIYVRIYSEYNSTTSLIRNRLLFIANMVLTLISAFWRCNWCWCWIKPSSLIRQQAFIAQLWQRGKGINCLSINQYKYMSKYKAKCINLIFIPHTNFCRFSRSIWTFQPTSKPWF